MPFDVPRRFLRLPAWVRFCLGALAAALGTALVLGVFALIAVIAEGPGGFDPFGPEWRWVSLILFGALTLLVNMLGNVASQRYLDWERRLPSIREFFQNQDLARLVGQSLGMVLRTCEPRLNDADARLVHRLARQAEAGWPDIAAGPLAKRFLKQIQERGLGDIVRNPDGHALTQAQTGLLLALLNPDAPGQAPEFSDSRGEALVREELARRFSEALRQALKRNAAQGGEAAYAMLLDLLTQAKAAMPRGADNAATLAAVRETLGSALPRLEALSLDLRGRSEAFARSLDATYEAVREEGERISQGIEVVRSTVQEGQQATDARLAAIEAQLREALAPRQAGEDPTQRQLPPELLAKARELQERGNQEQQAVAAIALKQHAEADRIIQDLKRAPLAEVFRLLTLEGENWYNAGLFDRAIQPYEQALDLRPDDPEAMHNAAIAHNQARLGDIVAHQRRAIDLLTQAQGVWTLDAHPVDWATTQNNLGVAWADLPTGDRGENLGNAIACYTAALGVRTRGAHPVAWAATQNNLGNAWLYMPTGDRGENLGKAIACYTAALEVRTREAHPVAWAATQNNLGNAWQFMPTGDRGENLRKAIACYTSALEVRTHEAHPVDWAMNQNNLGSAWQSLPTGDRGENLGKAIDCYTVALEVHTREAHPLGWAANENNLGNAWQSLPTGDRGENLGRAIACYTAALGVSTREAHPVDWAKTRFNLGLTYAIRAGIGGGGADLRLAVAQVRAAGTVWTEAAFPFDFQNAVAPALEGLRAEWLSGGHGTAGEFDAIAPAAG